MSPGRSSSRRGVAESRGFTLLELIIVVAVLAIIAALTIPALRNSRIAANEGSTISSLRTMSTVSEQYRTRFGQFAGDLGDLQTAGYLDSNLGSGSKAGYGFIYAAGPSTFTVTADPEAPGQSGLRYFYIDHSGIIRFSTTGTADAGSTPVDG